MTLGYWTSTTIQTTLKWCRQLGAITGLWTRGPTTTALIGMAGTAKKDLNYVQEEFDAAWKRRKFSHTSFAEHMWLIWDRYVGRILDTRFEVTRTTLNLKSFDMEMELDSYDMEMVVPISSDEDIHDKIETNECNKFGRSGGDVIKEEEKASTGQEDREIIKNSWSSKGKVESGEYVLSWPPKKPGGKEADEVGSTTTISRASATTFGNTTQTITNCLKNEKVTSIGLTIKEQEVFEEVLLRDIRHQIKGRSTEMEDKDAETASLTVYAASSTWGGAC